MVGFSGGARRKEPAMNQDDVYEAVARAQKTERRRQSIRAVLIVLGLAAFALVMVLIRNAQLRS